ncbi:MAG: ThiF family adenylyltransferase [Planctomycetales bacterium]|nr:ThiF family adenylyltransferase [bacterium]UNM09463.1 MAG: ThiF family adenylyltransferase [Planctomycetales bacterium]
MDSEIRYSRLSRYAPLGRVLPAWQQSHCVVIGLGGLGSGLSMQLTRFGVRRITLIDRDTVGFENLGHQSLFTTAHAEAGLPKVQAAAGMLAAINPAVELDPQFADLSRHNIRELCAGATLLFDGLDSYFTRYIVNDYALQSSTPWLSAGVVRGELSMRAVVPGVTGCLRCLLPDPPPPGSVPTCSAEGVFGPLLSVANAIQLEQAGRFLAGEFTADDDAMYSLELPDWRIRRLQLNGPAQTCRACSGSYDFLSGRFDQQAAAACSDGRFELELGSAIDIEGLAAGLSAETGWEVRPNRWCLVADHGAERYTVFPNGRLVLSGTQDGSRLNHFAAHWLGL